MIRTILLDAGGVLVRAKYGEWDIPAKLYEILGDRAESVPGPAWHAVHDKYKDIIREDVVLNIADEYVQRRKFLDAVGRELNWMLTEGELNALAEDFTLNTKRYIWYEDVVPLLERLHKKYRIGILSDAMPSVNLFIRMFEGGRHIFDEIVLSTQVGAYKPNSAMYHEILKRMNAAPEECIFVDDRACNLEGAELCGIRGIQMLRDGLEKSWNGDAVRNLSELEALLEMQQ